jgi:replicative DNA helicase
VTEQTYQSYATALDGYVEFAKSPMSGIGTGYSIDDECGVMGPGELALLWARSSAGKSTLLLNIINNTRDVPTVFFNMEMRAIAQAEWLTTMSGILGVNYHQLRGIIQSPDDPRHDELMGQLKEAGNNPPQVWFVEPRGPRVDDFARVVDDITVDTGIRPVRVVVDHLSLMYGARDYEGVSSTAAELHQWAQDDELAVIVAQQTGRSGNETGQKNDGHLPVTLSSGLYAGEHDADWIWGAWRPERDPKYRKPSSDFKKQDEYHRVQGERDRVRGLTHFAVIKNRPYGTLCEEGISLWWDPETRQLKESM